MNELMQIYDGIIPPSPIWKHLEPLKLSRSGKGLLDTPKLRPLRRVEWMTVDYEYIMNTCNEVQKCNFSNVENSTYCNYKMPILHQYYVPLYGYDATYTASLLTTVSAIDKVQNIYCPLTTEILEHLQRIQKISV